MVAVQDFESVAVEEDTTEPVKSAVSRYVHSRSRECHGK
jgi:hypothetical protein